jgi:hypothetical protein
MHIHAARRAAFCIAGQLADDAGRWRRMSDAIVFTLLSSAQKLSEIASLLHSPQVECASLPLDFDIDSFASGFAFCA